MRKLVHGIAVAARVDMPATAAAAPANHTITVSTTIQTAVDSARPGDGR